jgi:FtsH-binding integral membrane protein
MDRDAAKNRPAVITVICFLGFFITAFSAENLVRAAIEQGWSTFHSYFTVVLALTLAGYVGIWRMKKWGLVLYALTVAVNATLVWLVWGYPPAGVLVGALIAAVVVVIVLSQFSKMD